MRYGRFAYLMPAVPPPCVVRGGQCLTHGLTMLTQQRGAWCPRALPAALAVASKYEQLSAEPMPAWWAATWYRRRKWAQMRDEQLAAAHYIRTTATTYR